MTEQLARNAALVCGCIAGPPDQVRPHVDKIELLIIYIIKT